MPLKHANIACQEKAQANSEKAMALRLRGLSYRKIGEAISVSYQTAHNYVQKELAKIAEHCKEQAQDLRTIETERLDDALVRVTNSDAYRNGDPQAIGTMIRLSESRRKLLGLDQPSKVETDGQVEITVRHVNKPKYGDE